MQNINSIERNEVFDLAYRFVTETSENIFLTGKAGTGKTTFLKYLKENCAKNIIVAAPTGVAAINAGGVTLHSLFQLPFHPFLPTKNNNDELLAKIRFNKQRQQLLRKMELLVIDEISMVRCDTMDAIDTILKSVRRNYSTPFGGVQLLCIGDLFQLPPVAQRHEWSILQEYYPSPFFFDSIVAREQMPLLIELNKIYRQKEDSFVALLNKVRNNNMSGDDFEDLHLRYNPAFRPAIEEKYITLTSHNNQADQINARELQKLLPPSYKYEAIIEGDFPENNYPADGSLVLKLGAQVMFLKNDVISKRYFNGKIGIVKSLDDEEIIVECDGADISVSMETWENSRYVLDRIDGKLQQETLGTFTQFPLRLAWAITIHKSQGLTFEKVMIDAGAAFSSGQVYVALSRCTNLDGIVLLSKIPAEAIYSNDNVTKGHQALTHKGSLADRFAGARQIYTQQLLEEIFSFNEISTVADALSYQIKEHSDKLNQEGIEWIANFKNDFLADKKIGLKFVSQVSTLMKDEPVIENNEMLQKRINAAANHFEQKIAGYQQSLKNHPLITEHREVANIINEYMNQLALSLYSTNYFLQYCKQPFSVTSFLQHKLKFAQPAFRLSIYASGKKQSFTDVPNVELYEMLKQWRDEICDKSGMPIYMIANRATLTEIATYLPLTKKDLLQISGFGKAKVDKYGDDVLQLVQEYCSANNIETNIVAKEANPKRERKEKNNEVKTDTKTLSYNLFKEGKTVAEIAKERNFTVSTIEGHLGWFVGNGDIDINELVSLEKQLLIKAAAKTYGNSSHKILKDNLPENITYSEIRLVMAVEKVNS
ncbi:AAA family ATPase [Ginsengibacter hankyongi]|uniref:AAA family ATPase n=1 Tax=Ginsengibacter hankyongi TaxID=2607284 RepID=A0A5J5IL98_9BACT|nr:helix-turn-helix domain-containing protein [Ginsengibacter hankyongi]KAA9041491.1 AAA family ATPase [Ginsengibacter hankyongi]